MDYKTFYEKFGGSVRTKNVRFRPSFQVPVKSEIPKDIIRMCPWEVEYLFNVAKRTKVGAVETGRYKGGSTFVLACAIPNAPIHSIDVAPLNDRLILDLFAQHHIGKNVRLIVGDSQKEKYGIGELDFVFIDGDHTYEGCKNDIINWYENLRANGHLILHDCHYNSHYGVQDAVADFLMEHKELQVITTPFIGMQYWNYPAGSLAHFIKRG